MLVTEAGAGLVSAVCRCWSRRSRKHPVEGAGARPMDMAESVRRARPDSSLPSAGPCGVLA